MRKDPLWEELYQNLLNLVEGKTDGQQTGGAAPIEGYVRYDRNPYEEIQNDRMLSTDEKVKRIKEISSARDKEINEEHFKKMGKLYGGAALEIASGAIPVGGALGAKVAGQLAKPIIPSVGRKIARTIADNAVRGTLIGSVEGLGRGMLNDENPLKTITQDAVTGAVSGLGLSALGSNIQKVVRGKQLKSFGDIDQLDNIARKQYQKNAKSYYQDYIQSTNNNKNGQVDFTKRGIQEQLKWNPQQAQYLPELRNDFKYSKRLPDEPNKDINDKIYTDAFEIYRGNYGDHLVERFKDGSRRYYMTRNTSSGTPHATSTGSKGSVSNSIISENSQTLKPFNEWLEELKRKCGHK